MSITKKASEELAEHEDAPGWTNVELEGKVSRVKALADEWESLDGEPATDRDLTVLTVVNRSGRQLRAALEGR